jgi:metallophosphoesterase (TIGR03767 family)
MSSPTTIERALRWGSERRRGTAQVYRGLEWGPGESRVVRRDLFDGVECSATGSVSLLYFAHLGDPQIADVQSPGRFEFLEVLSDIPEAEIFYPATRPQEALNARAVEAMLRSMQRLGPSADTGASLSLLVSVGDNLDAALANELDWFLTLMRGGTIDQRSGGPSYEGVQDAAWGLPAYWHPDPACDRFRETLGFPDYPGLLEEAMEPFSAEGVNLPWLTTYGNHDGLVLGNSMPGTAYREITESGRKAIALPRGFDAIAHMAEFTSSPERFLAGPARGVTPSPARRVIGREQFVAAVSEAPGHPARHGLSADARPGGAAVGIYDVEAGPAPIRLVLLDTTNLDGGWQGSIGRGQLGWLERRLTEVSSRYVGRDGRWVETGAVRDHLVVLLSHHRLCDLVNDRSDAAGREHDQPRALAPEVEALVHRFPNVVLWANGHAHINSIRPHPDVGGRTAGFWEVTTSSVVDWPCQARVLELTVDARCDNLTVLTTMVDADAPADPANAEGLPYFAALHRELAANGSYGAASGSQGQSSDRNAALLLPMPFAITELGLGGARSS